MTSTRQIIKTPLIPFYDPSEKQHCERIYLKAENLQAFGSYKIRGIASLFAKTPSQELLKRGVKAASAGNMGQSLAYFAQLSGIPCTIYVPDTAPAIKKERIKALGATLQELAFADLWEMVKNPVFSPDEPLFVHPVFSKLLLDGYEQIAHEIIEDLPEVDAIIIPIGLGGLAIALSRAIKRLKPDVALFVCEPATAAPFKAAITCGAPVRIETQPSFVDAIGTPEILLETYRLLAPLILDSEVVEIEAIKTMVRHLLLGNKLLCEGAAACAVAAAKQLIQKTAYQKVVCILTGGNLALDTLKNILTTDTNP